MTKKCALVIGASGFLGSHIVKKLVAKDYRVRVLVRKTSNLETIKQLEVEKFYGDVMDKDSLQAAMKGCDYVFHSAVDTRAWLRDSAPLYRVNVEGLKNSMDAALASGIKKFVLTSSLITVGKNASGIASEDDLFDAWDTATDYEKTRVDGENALLEYAREKNLPGVACCVSNTYGDGDIQPTPHGNLIKQVVINRMPISWDAKAECVGVKDAAEALVLAAEKGVAGERYIVSSDFISCNDLFDMAKKYAKVWMPRVSLSRSVMNGMAVVSEGIFGMLNQDVQFSRAAVNIIFTAGKLDNSKARQQLGWNPAPLEESIKEAVQYYLEN